MFNIQHPDDWEVWEQDWLEQQEVLQEMAKQNVLVMVELDTAITDASDIEAILRHENGVKYIADWDLKEDDPDVVGETLSYILADSEWEEVEQ
jgi:hypothetical protein